MLIAKMVLGKLGPSAVDKAMASKMLGMAIQMSMMRISPVSSQPPA